MRRFEKELDAMLTELGMEGFERMIVAGPSGGYSICTHIVRGNKSSAH